MVNAHLDHAALARVLASQGVRVALEHLGEEVASEVRKQGIEVEGIPGDIALPVEVFSDEKSTAVILAHPAGLAAQAKDGALTKAASSLGLEVHG